MKANTIETAIVAFIFGMAAVFIPAMLVYGFSGHPNIRVGVDCVDSIASEAEFRSCVDAVIEKIRVTEAAERWSE